MEEEIVSNRWYDLADVSYLWRRARSGGGNDDEGLCYLYDIPLTFSLPSPHALKNERRNEKSLMKVSTLRLPFSFILGQWV